MCISVLTAHPCITRMPGALGVRRGRWVPATGVRHGCEPACGSPALYSWATTWIPYFFQVSTHTHKSTCFFMVFSYMSVYFILICFSPMPHTLSNVSLPSPRQTALLIWCHVYSHHPLCSYPWNISSFSLMTWFNDPDTHTHTRT